MLTRLFIHLFLTLFMFLRLCLTLQVRGVAAKALGAMVKGHGDGSFEELMPWLQQVLTSESNTVDRSGSAQG